MKLLEETTEPQLEEIELERIQTVGHSSLQAIGTAEYRGEEYDIRVSNTGDRVAVRASSGDEVYSTSLDYVFENESDLRYSFDELVEEADLDLAYSANRKRTAV